MTFDPLEQKYIELIHQIGQSVEIHYEPRNAPDQWYVGLADPHGRELPLHEHFPSLVEGLQWLADLKLARYF